MTTTLIEQDVEKGSRPIRILLLAPTGRDAETTVQILARAGFASEACSDAEELCRGIEQGAGLAIVTAEALTPRAMRRLATTFAAQPPWSELPLMIFVAQPEMDRAARSFEALGPRAHVTLVDRPIHVKTLLSSVRTSLRARLWQYDIRDLLEEQQKLLEKERASALRLSGLAEASLAIASALSLDDVLKMISDQAAKVINSAFALIWLKVKETTGRRTILAMSADAQRSLHVDERTEQLIDALACQIDGSVKLTSEQLRKLGGTPLFDGLRTLLAAPLLEREGEPAGLLMLAEKPNAAFTTDDETVLTQLAQMASVAVQNARLYREAQDANRAKDDFLATLAHELRTPMTGILGWVQMLKSEGVEQADVSAAIEMIESSTRVQARLVEDLLDVSRIIAGKLRVDLAPVELRPVVEAVVEMFHARAEERSITVETEIEPRPLSVYGDETRLHQVIWNLLSNAIKFTPEGGRVRVELQSSESKAILRVTDTGQGISPEFLPYVFERFRQFDNSTVRQQAGLGLGLAIVRHLVTLHGGQVVAASDGIGRGTTFTITLPLLAVRVEPADLQQLRSKPEMPRLNGLKILVVDDDDETGKLVALVLSQLGADAQAVTSVAAAVKTLRSFSADIVVSDIAMPGEDGYALIRRLREIEPQLGRQIPTMALTAYGRPEDRSRILASGFQKYIQKPVEPVELARAIESLKRN
ncbi:MAG TPA: ATP-binding protein [Thermoanaerobaculia bacterium]|jgi:signal transduction histidine kinase/PleD family two-component response regulator|nr:ATP-binding protein [Thermoanaerobaculia bacterium]